MSTFTVAQIRQSFLEFFAQRGHAVVASSSLVPANDPTLMFTNSGMVQFKDVFLGTDQRPYKRAASVQTCLRAGGKHNDLENVGYTARHHTFFEMLGNWSFGDYFKRQALQWAWELLTQVYKLPPERLLATVYHEDDEAYDIWTREIGLPPERVIRIGDNKGGKYKSDNFWMMADTGPCGPSSEIFYDHGEHIAGGPPGSKDEDGDRYIEIWNNVFMQFNMDEHGTLTPLPAPCVDTGMGLERLAAILQGVHSNYEIDLFQTLIAAAARSTGERDLNHPSLKVIADHIRACSFLVADGVLPSNEGRGYVQRRIIRRAIRHGYKLGQKQPFFHQLVDDLVAVMGDAHPKIREQAAHIRQTLQQEETRFFETLAHGMDILDAALADTDQLSGEVAFKLHDTYGFPLDLTQDICRERGVMMIETEFDAAMLAQKNKARAAGKFKMERTLDYSGAASEFTGYEATQENQAHVLAIFVDGQSVQTLQPQQEAILILDKTPFYAESGGQAGDKGTIAGLEGAAPDTVRFDVSDTRKLKTRAGECCGHYGKLAGTGRTLSVGQTVTAAVHEDLRRSTQRNHSATHLLHKALRDVLGAHVQQKGSYVFDEATRFDFSHPQPVSDAQLREIERTVNDEILANTDTQTRLMDIDAARNTGAMMLFGEKYGEVVRVVDIGNSTELCGGTHVSRTGDIGLFKIIAEGGVAAGVRRITAITGQAALGWLQQADATLKEAADLLKTPPAHMIERLQNMQAQTRQLERELEAVKQKLLASKGNDLADQAQTLDGSTPAKLLVAQLPGADPKALRGMVDQLKNKLQSAIVLLATVNDDDKISLAAGVTHDLSAHVKAGDLVGQVASQIGGKGGGRADMAMGGGSDVAALAQVLTQVRPWVEQQLGSH